MKLILLLFSLLIPVTVYCQKQVEVKIDRYPNGAARAEYSFYRDEKGNEVLQGKRTEWNEKGQKFSETMYLDGKAEGLITYWYDNGQKSDEGTYRNDLPEGVWLKWYRDGRMKETCEYTHGLKNGTCMYWNEKTREVDVVKYINGKPLAIVEWEKQNAGKSKEPVYLYPYIVVQPNSLTFTSNYAGISKEFTLAELKIVFNSLPKSVWVNGKEIGITSIGLATESSYCCARLCLTMFP